MLGFHSLLFLLILELPEVKVGFDKKTAAFKSCNKFSVRLSCGSSVLLWHHQCNTVQRILLSSWCDLKACSTLASKSMQYSVYRMFVFMLECAIAANRCFSCFFSWFFCTEKYTMTLILQITPHVKCVTLTQATICVDPFSMLLIHLSLPSMNWPSLCLWGQWPRQAHAMQYWCGRLVSSLSPHIVLPV